MLPTSQVDRARALIEQECHLTTAEQLERWQGRRDAAQQWLRECNGAIQVLLSMRELEEL